MINAVWKTLIALLVCLIGFDVIGVIACVFFDVVPLRGSDSGALPYAIWFVLGVFAGVFTLMWAGGWISGTGENFLDAKDAPAIATKIALISGAVLVLLSAFFWWLYWSRGVEGEYFVPDSMPHTLTFFLSLMGALVLFRTMLQPKAPTASKQ